jgi:hypothetical protein
MAAGRFKIMGKVVDTIEHLPTAVKVGGDGIAATVAGMAFFTDVMPNIIVIMSFIWFSMQMYTWVINKRWRREKNDEE